MLPELIETPFGHALAPLQLAAARQHSAELSRKHGDGANSADTLQRLKPRYLEQGYQPQGWNRTLHLVPAATPRSSYSHPLAGGSPGQELPATTYQDLARDPKLAEKMPFFQDRVPPQSGAFRIGDNSTQQGSSSASHSPPPTLVWERLVPKQPSRRADAKVIVAAHGLGFCRETWLPLLDDLAASNKRDHAIAEAWLVDALGHGSTAIYNASSIRSTDPQVLLSNQHRIVDSNDYARDLLQFLTCYLPSALESTSQQDAPLPTVLPFSPPSLPPRRLVGLGHSFGATSLLQLCVHLPELFESICAVEPILVREPLVDKAARIPLAKFTLFKADQWPSLHAASQAFAKDRMLSAWDPRVRSAFVAGGLYPINAASDADAGQDGVQRCCDRICEALCIRGNRPGIQLATHTLRHIPSSVKILYISCAKPLLLPLQEVQDVAKSNIPNLVFEALKGSHSLPLESPHVVADSIRRSLFSTHSVPVSSKL